MTPWQWNSFWILVDVYHLGDNFNVAELLFKLTILKRISQNICYSLDVAQVIIANWTLNSNWLKPNHKAVFGVIPHAWHFQIGVCMESPSPLNITKIKIIY